MLSTAGDEVTTIARDGCIRAWYWDTVDQADPPEEDPYVELNPVAETCVILILFLLFVTSLLTVKDSMKCTSLVNVKEMLCYGICCNAFVYFNSN